MTVVLSPPPSAFMLIFSFSLNSSYHSPHGNNCIFAARAVDKALLVVYNPAIDCAQARNQERSEPGPMEDSDSSDGNWHTPAVTAICCAYLYPSRAQVRFFAP